MRDADFCAMRSTSVCAASSALCWASSSRRRLGPRLAARTLTLEPRRSPSTAPSPAPSSSGATTSGGITEPLPVVLEQELLEHLGGLATGRVLQVEGLPVDDRPVAHQEHLHVGARLGLREPDDVERLALVHARRLALVHVAHGGEPVPQQRRLLELLRRRGGRHLALDVLLDLAEPAAQEVDRLVHGRHVLLARAAVVARAERALDEVLQAGRAAGAPRLGAAALAVREDAADELERLADLARARERAEVQVAGHAAAAEEAHARPLVVQRDLDGRVALVVAQAEVVRRALLLDEVVLEEERLRLGRRHHPVDVGRPARASRRCARGAAPTGAGSSRRACAAPSPCPRRAPPRRRRGSGRRRARWGCA